MKAKPRQSGFSLVELLVAMLIGLLITLGALTLINSLFKTYNRVDELARQQERITFTVESMIRGLRNAQNWKNEACDNSSEIDTSCIDADGRELQLYFEEEEADPETYVFSVQNTDSGYSLMETIAGQEADGAVVMDKLQNDGFLVCRGEADDKDNTAYLFRMSFCFEGAACSTGQESNPPKCDTPESDDKWQGWLRFQAVSRTLAIDKMLNGGE